MKKILAYKLGLFILIIISNSIFGQNPLLKKSDISRNNSQNCNEKYFIRPISNSDSLLITYDFAVTAANDFIVCGEIPNTITGDGGEGCLARFDTAGNKLWEKKLTGIKYQRPVRITRLQDNNFIVAGWDGEPYIENYFLIKFDINGNVLWTKNYKMSTAVLENFGISRIREDNDGSLIICGYYLESTLSFQDRLIFLKFDPSGNFLFCRYFKPNNVISLLYTNDFIIKNGYSYVVGTHLDNLSNIVKGYLAKIDNSNGNLVWAKVYDYNNGEASFLRIFEYPGNKLCILGQDDLNATNINSLIITDTAGSVISSNYFQFGNYRQFGSAAILPSGNIIYSNHSTLGFGAQLALLNIDPLTGVVFAKIHTQVSGSQQILKVMTSADNSIYTMGSLYPNNKAYSFLGKFNSSGEAGCIPENLTTQFGNAQVNASTVLLLTNSKNFITDNQTQSVTGNEIIEGDYLCNQINNCDTIAISGNDTLCHLSDTLTATVFLNNGCSSLPLLVYDHSFLSLKSYSGRVAKFIPLQNGYTEVIARLITNCDTLSDTLSILISFAPGPVFLGPDSSICPNNTLTLNARSGYISYLWQDGSTDSTFNVAFPGVYWVKTTDACNNIFRDTVVINPAPPIPFDLGPNLTKCNSDSLIVVAPTGFINYSWSPNYNINSTIAQSVVIFPSVDTMYKVAAEKTPGCFAYDSIYVSVNNSPPIYLGADTSFCSGNSVILNAGNGFANYLWNTGQSSSSITVNSAGVFSIIAADVNNCISKDTLRVINVFNNPVVNLPNDSLLCIGSSKNLNAGTGMASYLWSTGATTNSISVNNTGTYWVNVIDNNGCKGTDTTAITRLLVLPAAFLPADTVLCSYSTLKISASQTYLSYLWSTGSLQNNITISQPGNYWLRVTDNFNCVGSDTIIVNPKQCLEGFFIPNAFTPNQDGKNDAFRPLLFGVVKNLKFVIYNRWGQKVYETSKINEGWNGKVSGKETDSNVFVWTCEYQFEGQDRKFEKGTVVLIR